MDTNGRRGGLEAADAPEEPEDRRVYVLKSQLGIDIFADRHFSDVLRALVK